jgi:hypothetical protein
LTGFIAPRYLYAWAVNTLVVTTKTVKELDMTDECYDENERSDATTGDPRFADSTAELFQDLQSSGIGFRISWSANDGFDVSIGLNSGGSVAEANLQTSIDDATNWLRDKACELYPETAFASQYEPPYRSPCEPGTPEAQAAGCICAPGLDDYGYHYWEPKCPEHGRSSTRIIDGQLVRVDPYWRPGRPVMRETD